MNDLKDNQGEPGNFPVFTALRTREVAESVALRTSSRNANLAVALVNQLSLLGALEALLEKTALPEDARSRVSALLSMLSISAAQVVGVAGVDPDDLRALEKALMNDRKDALEELVRRRQGG